MTRSFFQSLESSGVRYLLISGQATVLYGGSAFSEDIDLWVEATDNNIASLKKALHAVEARYYKLTPELSRGQMDKGHGFHFTLGDNPPVYVDVLGRPPRVGSFEAATANSMLFDTDWGKIPVIGLKDLVEVKKTQRMEDYSVISRLAVEWLDRPECRKTDDDLRWALENIFTIGQLESFARQWTTRLANVTEGALARYINHTSSGEDAPVELENEISEMMQQRMQSLQQADRLYWREIIADLRKLKAENRLVATGAAV